MKRAGIFVRALALGYCAGAFIAADWDFHRWDMAERAMILVITLICIVFATAILETSHD